jgi:hypothetical protein
LVRPGQSAACYHMDRPDPNPPEIDPTSLPA